MPMSFPDPQSVTISGTAISLPRVSTGQFQSDYQSADGLVTLKIASAIGNSRIRRVARLDHSKLATDVFQPDRQVKRSMSCYLVLDVPQVGYTIAEAQAVHAGHKAAMTDALITKLLGGES